MKNYQAIYPGSFDPITMGHMDIIERMSKIFSHLVVLISDSVYKKNLFKREDRIHFASQALSHLSNVEVTYTSELIVNYAQKRNISIMVRGIRAVMDFEYEMAMANTNKKLAPHIEMLWVHSKPEYYSISSRNVKELAFFGGSLDGFVPDFIQEPLRQRIREHYSNEKTQHS